MDKPILLWVNLNVSSITTQPPLELARHCEIREARADRSVSTDAEDARPDVICLDYDYPDMASLRLIPETKKRYPSVPILMLTQQHSTDLLLWAFRARIFDVLLKPLVAADVERCFERLQQALIAKRTQSPRVARASAAQLPAESRYRPNTPIEARLQKAVIFISRNFSRKIRETEVASLCDLTAYRFSREFKSTFGQTFQDYLCACRINEAKRLLENPGIAITDVAMAVGFNDPAYFARVFRKETGSSPSDYRNSRNREADRGETRAPVELLLPRD